MKFRKLFENNYFDIRTINFFKISVDAELSHKFREPAQQPLKDLIQLVKKIKAKEIYAFAGIGTIGFVYMYMMFIYKTENVYEQRIYKNDNKIVLIHKDNFTDNEFEEYIKRYGKRWDFDRNLIYSN
jgi:ABC-type protease/lipase transport system fused ATPase/permease subunit